MVGRNDLMCDVDQKWNGPPPRCEALVCPEPPQILNGFYDIIAQTETSYQVSYECSPGFIMAGPNTLTCAEGAYDQPPPVCREILNGPRVPIVPLPPSIVPPSAIPPTTTKRAPVVTQTTTTPAPPVPTHEVEKFEEDNQYDDSAYGVGEDNVGNQGHEDDHGHHHEEEIEEKKNKPPTVVPVVPVKPPTPTTSRPNLDVNNGLDDPVLNNEGSESINVNIIHKGKTPNADVPRNSIEIQSKASAVSRLNLGKNRKIKYTEKVFD